ncbi:hypothetical protein C8J57DRAFT_1722248 [Mycena rebaudengoi]|nr:hypothetical protein C8J57DRAFT_1722248 [Mycena rebaudengoi]
MTSTAPLATVPEVTASGKSLPASTSSSRSPKRRTTPPATAHGDSARASRCAVYDRGCPRPDLASRDDEDIQSSRTHSRPPYHFSTVTRPILGSRATATLTLSYSAAVALISTQPWGHRPPLRLLGAKNLTGGIHIFPPSSRLDDQLAHNAISWFEARCFGFPYFGVFSSRINPMCSLVTIKLLDSPHKATVEATCGSIVALVCDSAIPEVVDVALWLLSRVPHLKFSPITTGVSVEARLLALIVDILKAPNFSEGHYPVIFQILSHLALRKSTAVAIVEANILNSVENHPRCHSTDLYKYIFPMLESLVSRKSTATAVLDMHLYDLLATLWREDPQNILPSTPALIKLLACMPASRDGRKAPRAWRLRNC